MNPRRFSIGRSVSIVTLVATAVLAVAGVASAQPSRIGPTTALHTGPIRYAAIAYDPAYDVYLALSGVNPVIGRFVSGDGVPLGVVFAVPQTQAYTMVPRVAYSPDLGGFLVTWLDLRADPNVAQVYGRRLSYQPGSVTPVFHGGDFLISVAAGGAHSESPAAVAYSTVSREFLVVWKQYDGGGGALNDVHGRRVGFDGALRGAEIAITFDIHWSEKPAVDYDPVTDTFLVVWQNYNEPAGPAGCHTRRVSAGSGAVGDTRILHQSTAVHITDVTYRSGSGNYLVTWFSGGVHFGQYATAEGAAVGATVPIVANSPSYDGWDVAHDHLTDTYFGVYHGSSFEDFGVEISSSLVSSTPIEATSTAADGVRGNYNPRIAARSVPREWMMAVQTSLLTPESRLNIQRLQGSTGLSPTIPAPTGLTITSTTTSRIDLSWTPGGQDAYTYHVQRSSNGLTGWTAIGTSSTTTYGDTQVTCGAAYYYRVYAVRTSDQAYSSYSNVANTGTGACPQMPILLDTTSAPNGAWFFAEGHASTSGYQFDTYYQIVNPNPVPVDLVFYLADEAGVTRKWTLQGAEAIPANTKKIVRLYQPVSTEAIYLTGSYGAVFLSKTPGAQVYASRHVLWGSNREGSTMEAGSRTPSRTWYFAEGSRNSEFFENFFTMFNPTSSAGTLTLSFFREDGQTVTRTIGISSQTRVTFDARTVAELANKSFSTTITSTVDVVAERSMYWGPNWMGGHCSIGVTAPLPSWFFAEGAVAPGFDTYYLLFNPNETAVRVSMTFYGANGVITTQTPWLQPRSRFTFSLRDVVGQVNPVAVNIVAMQGEGIIAERSMYWGAGGFPNWVEGTNSLGSHGTATEWKLPEGTVESGYETYVLLANPNTYDISVRLTVYSLVPGVAPYWWTEIVKANARLTLQMNERLAAKGVAAQFSSFSVDVEAEDETSPFAVEVSVYWRWDGANYWRAGGAMPAIRR